MKFGWINFFNAAIVFLILIPNLVYSLKNRNAGAVTLPKHLTICEWIGRIGCICLMLLPVFVWKFGFSSAAELEVYFLFNTVALFVYYLEWIRYGKKKSYREGMVLSVIPTAIFLLCGALLRHWSLVAVAVLFGYAHIKITELTHTDLKTKNRRI